MLNFCVYYYFSYNIIFVVFSWSFVGVGNFICESINYPTVTKWEHATIIIINDDISIIVVIIINNNTHGQWGKKKTSYKFSK